MLSVSTIRMRSRGTDRRLNAVSPAVGGSGNFPPSPAAVKHRSVATGDRGLARRPRLRALRVVLAATALLMPAAAWAAKATLSPRTVFLPIGGLQLPVGVSGELVYTLRSGQADIDGKLAADLASAQKQATPLLAALFDRKQPCGERLSVRSGQLGARGSALAVQASVDYGRTACIAGQEMKILPRALYDVEMLLHPIVGSRSLRMQAEVLTLRRRDGQLPATIDTALRDLLGSLIGQRIGELFPTGVPEDLRLQSLSFDEAEPGRLAARLRTSGSIPQAMLNQLVSRQ